MRKIPFHQQLEFFRVQLLHMIGIGMIGTVRILQFVWTGHDHQAARSQDAFDFGKHFFMLGMVLDGLETDHQINGAISKRNVRATTGDKLHIGPLIFGLRMGDRIRSNVHAIYARSRPGKDSRPVPFTAGDIQDDFPRCKILGHGIPVQMLQRNCALHLRQESLTGCLKFRQHVACLVHRWPPFVAPDSDTPAINARPAGYRYGTSRHSSKPLSKT